MAFSPATSVRLATIAFAGAAVTASALPVQAAPTPAPAPEQTTVSPAQKRAQARCVTSAPPPVSVPIAPARPWSGWR